MTPKRRQWIVFTSLSFVALVTWVLVPPSEAPFRDYVASLRAAGEAATFDDLVGERVPSEENGAEDLRAGRDWMEAEFGGPSDWPAVMPWNLDAEEWAGIPPETIEALGEFVPKWGPYLDRVASATAKPAIQVPLRQDTDRPDHPHLGGESIVEGAACRLGAIARASPDASRRIDAVAEQLRIAQRFRAASPGEHRTAMDIGRFAAENLRHLAEVGRLDATSARALLDPLLRRRWRDSLPAIFRGTRVAVVQLHETLLSENPPEWMEPEPWWRRLGRSSSCGCEHGDELRWYRRGHAAEIVDACSLLDRAAAAPPADLVAFRATVRAQADAAYDDPLEVRRAIASWTSRAAWTEAVQGLARVALAAAEHRATHGDFPASLDDLQPMFPDGVPTDVYTDAPFVYERTAPGARIASVGRLPEETPLDPATLRERCLVWELKR